MNLQSKKFFLPLFRFRQKKIEEWIRSKTWSPLYTKRILFVSFSIYLSLLFEIDSQTTTKQQWFRLAEIGRNQFLCQSIISRIEVILVRRNVKNERESMNITLPHRYIYKTMKIFVFFRLVSLLYFIFSSKKFFFCICVLKIIIGGRIESNAFTNRLCKPD